MNMINVLLIDDSTVMRNLLRAVVSSDKEIRVCGTGANGLLGIEAIEKYNPDVVILDIEMPEMSGLEALPLIRKRWPSLPVIMFSSLTEKGSKQTFEALTLGANECVCKPVAGKERIEAMSAMERELVPKIRRLYGQAQGGRAAVSKRGRRGETPVRRTLIRKSRPATKDRRDRSPAKKKSPSSASASNTASSPAGRRTKSGSFDIVAISSSTGGPNALSIVLKALPATLPIPIVITQHIPSNFASKLVERFVRDCPLEVLEVKEATPIKAGTIYFPTGDRHLLVERQGVHVVAKPDDGPAENFCRPAADPMLRSVVKVFGGNVLSVVLTGMGCDAMIGSLAVRDAGGRVIAQDEESSVVWGMPGAITKANGSDRVLPLEQIASDIIMTVQRRPVGLRG